MPLVDSDLEKLVELLNKIDIRVQIRRKTAAEWTSTNEVLLDSEWGYEHDTGKIKIGDGVTPWVGLDYFSSGTSLSADNAGAGIVIDDTDPASPIVVNDGVRTIIAGSGVSINAADPHNPIISATGSSASSQYQRMTSNGDFRVTSDVNLRVST